MKEGKWLSTIVICFALFFAFTVKADASSTEKDVTKCGDNLVCSFEDGVLEISGAGQMYDWRLTQNTPWKDYKNEVKTIIIHEGVTDIGNGAFRYFEQLENVEISDTVTKIGDSAFDSCYGLKMIKIPDSVLEIGDNVFYSCYNLEIIELSKNLIVLGYDTFDRCYNLKTIEIPVGVTKLSSTFCECNSLSNITLNEGLTEIGSFTFYRCESLKQLVFPKSLQKISDSRSVFQYCDKLEAIYFKGDVVEFPEDDEYLYGLNLTIYYPEQNETWTAETMKDYGGKIKWEPYFLEDCGNHEWTEWATVTSPTYTTEGLERRNCKDCATEEERVIERYIPERLEFDENVIELLSGQKIKLSITCNPVEPVTGEVKWSSSDERVASVDQNGNVTGKGNGTAIITAELGGVRTECTINISSRWIKDNVGYWYQRADGTYPSNGWFFIDDNWYYIDSRGYRVEGWINSSGQWYFLDEETGAMYAGQWIEDKYYVDPSGAMVTGWYFIGDYYYFDNSGAKVFNKWIGSYYLKADGKMAVSEWVDYNKSYVDSLGKYQTGWLLLDGDWYYLGTNGVLQKGWIKVGGTWYYGDKADGRIYEQEWLDDTYYLQDGGAMVTGWYLLDGDYYYFAGSGAKVTNQWVGNYYLKADGKMAVNEWIGNYYVGADGAWIPGYKK